MPNHTRFPHLVLGFLTLALQAFAASPTNPPPPTIESVTNEMNEAIGKVRAIVNQPVRPVAFNYNLRADHYPFWFHEGAIKPDFNTVDVRQSQESAYDKSAYVYSDLHPNLAYVGRQLEFNSMTKYFYVDRTVPKKKLTEPEMVEINRLYRIIGRCEQQLADLQNPPKPPVPVSFLASAFQGVTSKYPVLIGKENYIIALAALVILLLLMRWFRNRSA